MALARPLSARGAFGATASHAGRHESSPPGLIERGLAGILQRHIARAGVRVELWNGWSPTESAPLTLGALVLRDRRALLGLLLNPDLYFGECYTAGRIEVRGPLEPVLEALSRLVDASPSWRATLAAHLGFPNTLGLSRKNASHHYDIGNDFYEGWLDDRMLYTCAYYAHPGMTLEQAQFAKLERVCQKLRLRAGDTVVEAGCGWGALAIHMARYYGVTVTAFNVSGEQLALARERAAAAGVGAKVRFVDDDYRNVTGAYDVFVSLGMLEHVGLSQYGTLAQVLQRVLRKDTGRGLLHFIGRDAPHPINAWIRRRIFPGSYCPTLAEVTTHVLTPAGMSVLDVENLRLHYARTLAHWSGRFAARADDVRPRYGDELYRAWTLYLAGSEAAFATGWLQLFQIVFAGRDTPPPAWTRDDPFELRGGVGADV